MSLSPVGEFRSVSPNIPTCTISAMPTNDPPTLSNSKSPDPQTPLEYGTALSGVVKDDISTTDHPPIPLPSQYREGATHEVTLNRFERNPHAREQCIAHYGCRCSVCDFDFEHVYGEIGRAFIHVHHLKPLAEIRKEYVIDPIADMRPICPNCHAMIHKCSEMMTIETLRVHAKITSEYQA